MTDPQILRSVPVKTKRGIFLLHFSSKGLYSIRFPSRHPTLRPGLRRAGREVEAYFKDPKKALNIKIDLAGYTAFQKDVYRVLRQVPAGKVITYGELARKSGHPKAVRAVGSAMRKNRLPIAIPCHRVISSNGALGEYSAGKQWKRFLLRHEGAI